LAPLTSSQDQFPRVAKYDLQEELGHGGMATVYRARDRRLGRDVALKVIHRHLRDSGEVARRFTAEAHAVAKLKHPNIVEIYDVSDEDAPERYLVAELIRGQSLRTLLSKRTVLPPEIGACIGVELASALHHAHERGVIHRDVKPENVLFQIPWVDQPHPESPEHALACVKLTDFGIAKLLDQQGVTSTGQVLGSPAYMAPEQIDGDAVDVRADVFGLGVLLYECMAGRLPFDGKTPGQVLKAILQGHYTPADQERPAIGTRWASLLQRAIEPDPARRYPTMATLRAGLEAELAQFDITDPRRELTAYLRDPEGYETNLTQRLVPLLREQGRRALRKGDRMAAAAAINRACALAPSDPEVMGLVRQLVQVGSLERWKSRLLLAVGASLLGGGAAALGWRWSKPTPITPARPLPAMAWVLPSASSSPPPSSPVASSSPPASVPSAAGSGHRLATPAVGPRIGTSPPGPLRKVRLFLSPPSARWNLDGNPLPDTNLHETELPVGSSHTIEAYTLPNNSCCESPLKKTFEVQPSDGGEVQTVNVYLPLIPARLEVQGAVGLYFLCPTLFGDSTLRPVGRSYQIRLQRVREQGTCFLRDGPEVRGERVVELRAGQSTGLAW
jgi:serine/threonine-protein kinase